MASRERFMRGPRVTTYVTSGRYRQRAGAFARWAALNRSIGEPVFGVMPRDGTDLSDVASPALEFVRVEVLWYS